MFPANSCRLCVTICHDHRGLYDQEGRRNEVYLLMEKYFTPMLMNMEYGRDLRVICLECWRHIWEFHTFQQSILLAHRSLNERIDPPSPTSPESKATEVHAANEVRFGVSEILTSSSVSEEVAPPSRCNITSPESKVTEVHHPNEVRFGVSEILRTSSISEGIQPHSRCNTTSLESKLTEVHPANEVRFGVSEILTYSSLSEEVASPSRCNTTSPESKVTDHRNEAHLGVSQLLTISNASDFSNHRQADSCNNGGERDFPRATTEFNGNFTRVAITTPMGGHGEVEIQSLEAWNCTPVSGNASYNGGETNQPSELILKFEAETHHLNDRTYASCGDFNPQSELILNSEAEDYHPDDGTLTSCVDGNVGEQSEPMATSNVEEPETKSSSIEDLRSSAASTISFDNDGETNQQFQAILKPVEPPNNVDQQYGPMANVKVEESATKSPSFEDLPDRGNVSEESGEECEEYDDPVGVFVGGEFDKPTKENEESETESVTGSEWSVTASEWSLESYSSDDEVPLAVQTRRKDKKAHQKQVSQKATSRTSQANDKRRKRNSNAIDSKRGKSDQHSDGSEESEEFGGNFGADDERPLAALTRLRKNAPTQMDTPEKQVSEKASSETSSSNGSGKRRKRNSSGENSKRHKSLQQFDESESEEFGGTFGANDERPLAECEAATRRANAERKRDNSRDRGSKPVDSPGNSKRVHKTALEFDTSESEESECGTDEPSTLQNNANPPSNSASTCRTRYSAKFKQLQTVEEFDDFIAQWRPNLECVACPETCSSFSLLQQHFAKQHPTKKCHIVCCQQKFHQRYEIEKHIHYHNERFKCEVCFSSFTQAYNLRDHLMTLHAGERVECPQCARSFSNRKSLKKHMKFACNSGQSPRTGQEAAQRYSCSECGKNYKTRKILSKHKRRVHLKRYKLHKCNICDKVFKSVTRLREHMAIHGGERTHTCPLCPNKFLTHSRAMDHMRKIHLKEWQEKQKEKAERRKNKEKKIYKCDTCTKEYQTSLALNEHKATHAGKPKYTCKLCPKTYKYSSNVAAHFKRVHAKEQQITKKKKKD